MRRQYHILNGDSLKQQFPENIQGNIIVAKECLVDGNVKGNDLDELFHTRSQFISNNYEGYSEQDYYEKTVPEFQKIKTIDDDSDINIWFENDLFCQVNFWFVAHLLLTIMKELETEEFGPVFREFSKRESIYGFGNLQVKRLFDEVKNNR